MRYVLHVDKTPDTLTFIPLAAREMSDIDLQPGMVVHAIDDDGNCYGSFGCVLAPAPTKQIDVTLSLPGI